MVEKPLAVDMKDARAMAKLARKHNIHLLTNYETTWYATTQEILEMEADELLGPTRKIVIHDGHRGPIEINVPPEFEYWLTDPVLNGGGAIMDFGCYGANIMTAMMGNQPPLAVTAVTQTIKPDIYKRVDDEATIILTYPEAQGIIQASWNWPISRKDVELYGKTGALRTVNATKMFVQVDRRQKLEEVNLPTPPTPMNDPYVYFAAVVRGDLDPNGDLSSLENAMITMQILDAARESARTGKTITLNVP
jgi:predicted dehydrogenase